MKITLILDPPIIFEEPVQLDEIFRAICDVNGEKRIIGEGATKGAAVDDLRDKLRKYLNGIFW